MKDSIERKNIKKRLKKAHVGDYITFGTYRHGTSEEKQDIEWLVLQKTQRKILVISKYGIDCKQYHNEWVDITWENCTLRKWLNNGFINAAFSKNEMELISTVTVSADKNEESDCSPGNDTQDRVFLLSMPEAEKYFSSDEERMCKPTAYAIANKAYATGTTGIGWWWLRSPGWWQNDAAYVDENGGVFATGDRVDYRFTTVRPAMWIDVAFAFFNI